MKFIRVVLMAGMTIISSATFAQSKGEMPFTSSSQEAKKMLRQAWVAYGDAKFDEADKYVRQALEKDPEFGLAYAFIHTDHAAVRGQNLRKASSYQLSPDERMLIDGLLAAENREAITDHFEPLLTKYPKDAYLNLWIMFNHGDPKRRTEIGEMIIKRNPKFAPAYNMLGYAYMEQGNLEKAEANFNKYLSLSPNLANAYDSKADYLMRAGRIEEAITLFEKASEMGMAPSKGRAEVARTKLKYPEPSDDDKQKIKDIVAASTAAHVTGDADEVLKNYAEQSIELYPSQVVNAGRANIRTRLKGLFNGISFTKLETSLDSIQGAGPIALAWGTTKAEFKSKYDGSLNEGTGHDIFLFRKQDDRQWKILAHHWVTNDVGVTRQPANDSSEIRQLIDKWSFCIKPGGVFTDEHVENLAAIYSPQAVDIYPNLQSNIGRANHYLRWEGFKGITWAQFTDLTFDVNSFATIGAEGFAQRAVAWGIGDHTHYAKGSDKVSQFLFPWAMILTKEKDGKWRILVYHFYLG